MASLTGNPDLQITIGLPDGEFQRAARRIVGGTSRMAREMGQQFDQVERRVGMLNRAMGSVRGSVGAVSTALGTMGGNLLTSAITNLIDFGTNAVTAGFKFNDFMAKARISYEVLLGSQEKAKKSLEELKLFAKTTPFELPDVVDAGRSLLNYGIAAEKLVPTLRAIGEATNAAGGGTERFNRIITAIGQMRSATKLSTEELNQLRDAGVPALDILSKVSGIGRDELQKLIAEGRISGEQAANALLEGFGKKYSGLMDRFANETIEGRTSNLKDSYNQQLGAATQQGYQTYLEMLGRAQQGLDGPGGRAIIGAVGQTTNVTLLALDQVVQNLPSGEWVAKFAKTGGELINGLFDGISNNSPKVLQAVTGLAESTISTAKSLFGIQSPSTVFDEIGQWIAEGLALGLSKGQAKVYANLKKLMSMESDFLPTLIAESKKRGINPNDLVNLMAVETAGSFNKSIRNPFGYVGLIQFGAGARRDVGLPTDTGEAQKYLSSISATEQLQYVFRYLDGYMKRFGALDSAAKLYASVGAGEVLPDDSMVIRRGRRGTRRFARNQAWNVNGDDVIQQWELGASAQRKLGAGQKFDVVALTNGRGATPQNPQYVYLVNDGMFKGFVDLANEQAGQRNWRATFKQSDWWNDLQDTRTPEERAATAARTKAFLESLKNQEISTNAQVGWNLNLKPLIEEPDWLKELRRKEAEAAVAGTPESQMDWRSKLIIPEEVQSENENRLRQMAQAADQILGDAFEQALVGNFGQAWDGVVSGFRGMLAQMTKDLLMSPLRQGISNLFKGLLGGGGAGGGVSGTPGFAGGSGAAGAVGNAVGAATGGGGGFWGWLGSLFKGRKSAGATVSGNVGDVAGTPGITGDLPKAGSAIGGTLGQLATNLGGNAVGKAAGTVGKLTGFKGLLGGVAGAFPLLGLQIGGQVGGPLGAVGGALLGAFGLASVASAASAAAVAAGGVGLVGTAGTAAALFSNPITAIIGAGLLIGGIFLSRARQRRRDERERDRILGDTLKQIKDLTKGVKDFTIDGNSAISQAKQIRENYLQQINALKTGSVRRSALNNQLPQVDAAIKELEAAAKNQESRRRRMENRRPEFRDGGLVGARMADGGSLTPFRARPYESDYFKKHLGLITEGKGWPVDDVPIMAGKTEAVINQIHIAKLGGAPAMRRAGVPGFALGGLTTVSMPAPTPVMSGTPTINIYLTSELNLGKETAAGIVEMAAETDRGERVHVKVHNNAKRKGMVK
jgi:tape measure domain-containing protein